MPRFVACALIAALFVPFLPTFSAQAASCCCKSMSHGSCPLRAHEAKGCDAKRSCSMNRAGDVDLSHYRLPEFLSTVPVLLEQRVRFAAPPDLTILASAEKALPHALASPPDPPPPRLA